jgi:hypothetical protein
MESTNLIGMLSRPTVVSAFGKLIQSGLDVGGSKTSIPEFNQAIAQAMKGSDPKDIAALQNIGREFAKMELIESKNYLKGQGSVSDAERALLKRIVADASNNPESIKDFLKFTEMRAKLDDRVGPIWDKYQVDNPGVSFNKFRLESPEFKQAKADYAQELKNFTLSSGRQTPKGETANTKAHPGASLVDKYLNKQ